VTILLHIHYRPVPVAKLVQFGRSEDDLFQFRRCMGVHAHTHTLQNTNGQTQSIV
jgi:hypothetical protein